MVIMDERGKPLRKVSITLDLKEVEWFLQGLTEQIGDVRPGTKGEVTIALFATK